MVSALLAAALISLLSLSGALVLVVGQRFLHKLLIFLVALSAGAMMGGSFFHLIPESIELFPEESLLPFLLVTGGFSLFFILERFVFWHHCHETEDCGTHPYGYMNLIGDGLHNFLDGLLIAAAFATDVQVGIAATLAIISHEIPQEISDFGVLLHSGMRPAKALLFNFISSVFSILGVLVGGILNDRVENIQPFLLAFAAGGFIYIAASDLVPELHKEKNLKKATGSFLFFLLGIGLMILTKILFE